MFGKVSKLKSKKLHRRILSKILNFDFKKIDFKITRLYLYFQSTQWWVNVRNATWFNPEGPDSHIYSR